MDGKYECVYGLSMCYMYDYIQMKWKVWINYDVKRIPCV